MPSRPTRRPTLTIKSTTAASNASTDASCITLPSPSSVALLQTTYMSVLAKTADSEATIRWCMAVGLLPTSQLCATLLMTIVKQYIKPGTTIMSDQYASYVSVNQKHTLANYKPLREMHYKHEWANHLKNYVDPDTGAHTNQIEGTWEIRIKQHIKHMRGMPVDMISEYLDEFLWRSWFLSEKATPTDSLRGLIKVIRKYA